MIPNRPRVVPITLVAALALGPATAGARAEPSVAGTPAADAAALAAATRFLASDLLEGRGPGSRGDQLTRAYLATELEAAGLAPGGENGGWEQRFEMVGVDTRAPALWRFGSGARAVELQQREDFVATSGRQAPSSALADAEVVFVGYGIQAPEHGWDDFKGVDLRGKVLLMLNNDPDWDPALFAGKTRLYYGRWTYKYESAERQGAAGAIIVHTTPSAGYPWQVVQSSWSGEQFELPETGATGVAVQGWLTEGAAARVAAAGGQDLARLIESARSRDFRPVPLGITTSLELTAALRRVETANVLGLLRGGDPALREQVVIYTAHHDHLGIGEASADGDTIHNGAVDNATGCAQLLAIARAFAALPERPRRSILFAFVAAEEQGLLGSRWYAEHPTFPAGRIAANVNVDSANIYGRTSDVTFIGRGKSTLDAVVERAAAAQGREVKSDPSPDKGSFYRSDQFSFARIGVPAFYLDPGTTFVGPGAAEAARRQAAYDETCYHQPCDEIGDDWVWDGMAEDARLAFEVGRAVADADDPPAWNAGDEFEAARKAALAAVAGP